MEKIRVLTENLEKETLSPYATLSTESVGREKQEEKCELRTDFQRDRDRIIHCKAFRRLKHKTQVFLSPESDHYRTRLTHTLEVAQIARTIARALRFNEDLTEAIALGHDLGHTPFGHAGERALATIYPGGFTHYAQSVRVCRVIEKNGKGLNLTHEVLDGIMNHTKGEWPHTPEGKIVRFSDRIAYINHDIDDAITAGVFSEESIPIEYRQVLGFRKSERINTLVKSIVENTEKDDVKMDERTQKAYEDLHTFMYDSVYLNPIVKFEETKVDGIVSGIYDYLLKNPDKLDDEYKLIREREGVERAAVDYISGMTDHFAVSMYSDIYIPKEWKV
ncbi:MAG: deoxyguanosinetriphosphate triphosphohydrolase [Clostridia bacterium]|nr:deoxyguanosinetriphosphate triphosphohydrolase [Clostridia bacterium]MBR3592267.1 deoxyguanosinetriphosphate triphosphohydrolase [Clostridia bacterium]